jgi:diguanylate cyclase (GGDEF)-like protein
MKTALAELSQRLLKPTTIEEMSSLVLEHARRLTGSRTGFVGYVDQESGRLLPSSMTPDAREILADHPEMTWKAHESSELWGWVRRIKKPILSNLPSLDPRYGGTPDWHLPVSQFLSVPAVMDDELVGLISLANSERMYGEQDLEVIERLAALYAITVYRARTEAKLRELSLEDELTRLYNRRGFLTLAEQQLKIANRTKKEMVLLYADLDELKRINDGQGHGAGDRAIVEVAAVLKEAFRESDIIARIGGDEFAVLAIDIQGMKPAAMIKRITDNLETWNGRSGRTYILSLSLGTAIYNPAKPCGIQELLASADRRMYEDKAAKKARLSL